MSVVDADTSSADHDYGQYDDLEAALVIAAADADARNHVRLEEEQEEGANGVKQDYQESLGYYQNDENPKEQVEVARKSLKRMLSEDKEEEREEEQRSPGNFASRYLVYPFRSNNCGNNQCVFKVQYV